MDANGTRYHLLLGEADWAACRCTARADAAEADWGRLSDPNASAQWDARTQEARLRLKPFVFPAAPLDRAPDLSSRRGAASDSFGRWYSIDEASQRIRVWSEAAGTQDFWPRADAGDDTASDDFSDVDASAPTGAMRLSGLTVTSAYYLVVGTIQPAGVLVFDLLGGGDPRHLLWPAGTEFEPFDMAAGPECTTWILDRAHQRVWTLDRSFAMVIRKEADSDPAPQPGGFQDADSAATAAPAASTASTPVLPLEQRAAIALAALDPIAIDVLADGTLVVLDRVANYVVSSPCSGLWLYRNGAVCPWAATAAGGPHNVLLLRGEEVGVNANWPALRGYDLLAVPDTNAGGAAATLYIVDAAGNQAYAFSLTEAANGPGLQLRPEYLPLRRFGGKGLAPGAGGPRYDFAQAWVPLVEQQRPRFEASAFLRPRVFDGKQAQCVWHRVLFDGSIPSETSVRICSRASDEEGRLPLQAWSIEPLAYRRRDGSELPFAPSPWNEARGDRGALGQGTWELLLQSARGRYLELMIELGGNELATPRLQAMRVYYARFSYLDHYLPAVYRDDADSARFLERLLANFEGMFTAIEDRIASADALLDWRTAPRDALDWLAGWLGAALDPAWEERRRRLFIQHARLLFRYRGTAHGLKMALALALDAIPDPRLFDEPERVQSRRFGVRVVEQYLARRLPDVLLGDPSQLEAAPGDVDGAAWKPADGTEVLNARYARFLSGDSGSVPAVGWPLVAPNDPEASGLWAQFSEQTLGFAPRAASLELQAWQAFLEAEYGDIDEINKSWQTAYDDFTQIVQFADWPALGVQRDAWTRHMRAARPARTPRERLQWQGFLRQRYGAVSTFNTQYNTAWPAYDLVPVPDRLPADGEPVTDWYQFEAGVLAISGAAHRFRVLLPMPTGAAFNVNEPRRRLDLAQRVVEFAKPAHTSFDLRFYWAMFRLGEARLGLDTRIDKNMREQLIPPMVLGRDFVGESRVAPSFADATRQRTVLGARRLSD